MEELIHRIKHKDRKAFADLHRLYAGNILGLIHTIVRDAEKAEELCQDVFVKVWENASSYDASKGRLFTWLLNIARNSAIDYLRSKSFQEKKMNFYLSDLVHISGEEADTEPDTPYQTERIRKLVLGLKDRCVELIDLLFYQGYTQKEASEQLDIPVGTVKTRLRACIMKLRNIISSTG